MRIWVNMSAPPTVSESTLDPVVGEPAQVVALRLVGVRHRQIRPERADLVGTVLDGGALAMHGPADLPREVLAMLDPGGAEDSQPGRAMMGR
jgi:hypothetical protein